MDYDIKKNTLEDCLKHWKNPQDHNDPVNYNKKHTYQRSRYLVSIFNKYIKNRNFNILEIGCNCCRNLHYLYNANYNNLTGIEINKNALDLQKAFFPNLKAKYINSSIEDYILKFKDNEFDIVFSMAVLQHIHIDSNWTFEHIARITSKYIVLIELEVRNYKNIFEWFSFKQIEKRSCHLIKGLEKYKMMIFERN